MNYRRITGEFPVIGDQSGLGRFSSRDLVDAVDDLGAPWTDDEGRVREKVLCYRDNRGTVAYVVLMATSDQYQHIGQSSVMPLEFVEVGFPGRIATIGET
jgi:hypothetical protein